MIRLAPFIGLAAITILIRIPFAFDPVLNWDESSFLLVARSIAEGHLPYTHAWDNKPPLLFVPYALALLVFGENVVGTRLAGIVLVALAAGLLRHAVARLWSSSAGWMAAVFLILFVSLKPGDFATMSEHVALPVLCAAIALVLRSKLEARHLLLLGLALGLCALIRTNLILLAPFFLVCLMVRPDRPGAAGLLLAAFGFLAPAGVVSVVYFAAGEFDLLYRSTVLAPKAYMSVSYALTPAESLSKMFRALARFPQSMILWTAGIGIVYALADSVKKGVPGRPVVMLLLLLAGSILAVVSTSRYFNHYFIQVAPVASVFAGRALAVLWQRKPGALAAVLILCMPLGPVLEKSREVASDMVAGNVFQTSIERAARHVREQGGRGAYAYFPQHHIGYLLSGSRLPTRFVHPPALVKSEMVEVVLGEGNDTVSEIRSILGKHPEFIVKKGNDFGYFRSRKSAAIQDSILEEILRHYRLETEFDGIEVYRRIRQETH